MRWTWYREPDYAFPLYSATLNRHKLSVWRVEPGYWSVAVVTTKGREVEITTARSVGAAKHIALGWATSLRPEDVRIRRAMRAGEVQWVYDPIATEAARQSGLARPLVSGILS